MLCDVCHQNIATTHIKTVINGKVSERHLCSHCAATEESEEIFSFKNPLSDMLTSIFGNASETGALKSTKRCNCCGSSFSEIVNSGKLGCSECYETFFDELLPYLNRVHGSIKHIGKAAGLPVSEDTPRKESTEELKEKLKELISEERFEEAAVIRDKIRATEEEK